MRIWFKAQTVVEHITTAVLSQQAFKFIENSASFGQKLRIDVEDPDS